MPKVFGVSASPFVRKVLVVLAEKGIAYDLDPVIPINVSPEFRKISPLGKVPAFEDGGRTLSDSSVICAYLERKYPQPPLYPADPYEHARALWFEEYGDTALVQVIGPKIFAEKVLAPRFFNRPIAEDVVSKAVNEELPPLLDYLEGQLVGEYLVGGAFSIGDIGIVTQLVNLKHAGYGVDSSRWPKLAVYAERLFERPSFKRLIEEETALLGGSA